MASSKFNGMYEYMGFAITNDGDAHEWNIEPIEWDLRAVERFKGEAPIPIIKTLAAAKKWIRANSEQYREADFL